MNLDNFRALRIADNDGNFYYFKSTDHTIKINYEQSFHKQQLRFEIDKGVLNRKFKGWYCPGPKGRKGIDGEQGNRGLSAKNELIYDIDHEDNDRQHQTR